MSTMDGSVFEGLFVRQLKPDAALRAELAKVGFDPARLEAKYPEEVFARAVDVVVSHDFAGKSLEETHRALGIALIDGYFDTILGRITGSMMPMLGVGGALKRVQQLWRVAQPSMTVAATPTSPTTWDITFENKVMRAEMVAGILEAALLRADKRARVSVVEHRPGGGKLLCTLVA